MVTPVAFVDQQCREVKGFTNDFSLTENDVEEGLNRKHASTLLRLVPEGPCQSRPQGRWAKRRGRGKKSERAERLEERFHLRSRGVRDCAD